MSTMSDEELQRMAEQGAENSSNDRDLAAYQYLFDVLRQPTIVMPAGVENAIIAKIEKNKKRNTMIDHMWLVIGVLFIVLAGIAVILYVKLSISFSGGERSILTLGTCAGLVIALLNALERKLLHR